MIDRIDQWSTEFGSATLGDHIAAAAPPDATTLLRRRRRRSIQLSAAAFEVSRPHVVDEMLLQRRGSVRRRDAAPFMSTPKMTSSTAAETIDYCRRVLKAVDDVEFSSSADDDVAVTSLVSMVTHKWASDRYPPKVVGQMRSIARPRADTAAARCKTCATARRLTNSRSEVMPARQVLIEMVNRRAVKQRKPETNDIKPNNDDITMRFYAVEHGSDKLKNTDENNNYRENAAGVKRPPAPRSKRSATKPEVPLSASVADVATASVSDSSSASDSAPLPATMKQQQPLQQHGDTVRSKTAPRSSTRVATTDALSTEARREDDDESGREYASPFHGGGSGYGAEVVALHKVGHVLHYASIAILGVFVIQVNGVPAACATRARS
jgi:hypothetical protein